MSLGLRVMLNALLGRDDNANALVGQVVTAAELRDDALWLTTTTGQQFKVFDDGQSCCENRYMVSDDDAADLVGGTVCKIEVLDAPSVPDEYGNHEVQFLRIETDDATWTARCHNEHNGYYGGFCLTVQEVSA